MIKGFCVGDIRVVFDKDLGVETFDAVVAIVFASDKIVLIRNKDRGWEFPGGHREGNESCEETAAREAYEEAGMRITGIKRLGYYVTLAGHVTVIVCAAAASFQETVSGHEAPQVGLFDELPAHLSFGDGREQMFLEYARQGKGHAQ